MVIKTAAIIFGVVFLLAGLLGFVPALTPNHLFLGLLMVDPVHNGIHILTGIVALIAAYHYDWSILYFKVFGIIYALVTIAGFLMQGNLIITHMNTADNFFHLIVAIVALYLGFFYRKTHFAFFKS
jgi:hypothetical protein